MKKASFPFKQLYLKEFFVLGKKMCCIFNNFFAKSDPDPALRSQGPETEPLKKVSGLRGSQ